MPDTNQSQNSMEADAQSGRTRFGAPDGPRQKRSKMQDRSEPLEFPGHERVAEFMATPKSLREFESVTALAKHFNITTKTIYCWMKDDDVLRRAEWLSMRNKRHGDLSIRCRYEEIIEKLIEMALTGNVAAVTSLAVVVLLDLACLSPLASLGTSSVWSRFRFTTSRGGENSNGTMGIFAPALTRTPIYEIGALDFGAIGCDVRIIPSHPPSFTTRVKHHGFDSRPSSILMLLPMRP